ncbi:hypothetical protein ACFRFL_40970 [Streptomyces sp. NPDC056708]|uniref:hypothetical protein n=1 Tax=unclassified Streptomyces TaxID=2593676 RepID=UPI0036A97753
MFGLILTEVGKRVSGRWITAVLLPGLLLALTAGTAAALGHAHALNLDRLIAQTARLGGWLGVEPARPLVVAVLVATGAALAGTAAGGLGQLTQRWWLRERALTGAWFVRSRFSRRSRALADAERAGITPVAAYLPRRPTWMGDRVRLIEVRIKAEYRLSAAVVWPRIWLLVGEEARQPVLDARVRLSEAVALAGWSMLYILVGVVWWPALAVGVAIWFTGWRRARSCIAELATLAEAMIDIQLPALAEAVGVAAPETRFSEAEGRVLGDRLGKSGQP